MLKNLRILCFIILFMFLVISPVYAIDMNLSDNTTTNTTDNSITNSTLNTNTVGNTLSNTTTSDLFNNTNNAPAPSTPNTSGGGSASVSYLSSLPEADLGLNNILNILLIVIGILLILLGIAIIIRLK